jgi:hypothetical protein
MPNGVQNFTGDQRECRNMVSPPNLIHPRISDRKSVLLEEGKNHHDVRMFVQAIMYCRASSCLGVMSHILLALISSGHSTMINLEYQEHSRIPSLRLVFPLKVWSFTEII